MAQDILLKMEKRRMLKSNADEYIKPDKEKINQEGMPISERKDAY